MGSRGDIQLCEDALYVEPNGPFTHAHDFGDLPIRLALPDPVEDRHFTQCEFSDTGSNGLRTLWSSAQESKMDVVSKVLDERHVPFRIHTFS